MLSFILRVFCVFAKATLIVFSFFSVFCLLALALLDLIDKLTDSIENNETTLRIFIDLAKAFDTVNHNILFQNYITMAFAELHTDGSYVIWITELGMFMCASGCVVECRICNREVAGSNLSLGYFEPRSTRPSIPPGSVNEYQLRLGRQRQVWLIPIADECVGVQVKLKSLENTCHTWALLRWWFTTKRRYIKCMHLYLYSILLSVRHVEFPQGSILGPCSSCYTLMTWIPYQIFLLL